MRKENSLIGELCVGYGLLKRSFSSRVSFDRRKGLVKMQAENDLFTHFESRWHITHGEKTGEANATLVDFFIDFQLRALPLKFVFENLFCQAAERMVEAFEQRANSITPTASPALANVSVVRLGR